MGNANNPIATMGAKKKANEAAQSAQDGLKTLTAAKTEEQKAHAERAKNRYAEFEQKKKDRAERKKKLQAQWAANKK